MPERNEIIDALSSQTTDSRRGFIRAYQDVTDHSLEFGGRAADKTADSHGEKDGRRVTFLAQDGSYPELPYFTDESGDHAIGKSLDTALGAVNNRLKALSPDNPGQSPQSELYKERREAVNLGISNAAFVLLESGEISGDLQGEAADQLREFLARNGSVLSGEQMHTAAGNFIVATAANLNTALEEVRHKQA